MSKGQIYGLRVGIGLLIYLFFKISTESYNEWTTVTYVSLAYTIIIVLLVFEVIDFTAKHLIRHYKDQLTSYHTLTKFYIGNCLITAPVVIVSSYIHNEFLVPAFHCCDWETGLVTTISQGLVLSWLIIGAKTFMIYFEYTRISERKNAQLQTELAQSKFESLKDQVKPHFLFNSFSVLASIIEEDQKLAVEFVSRLSKIYRYLLDSHSQLVSLDKELEYLEHYVFLLKIRHHDSLVVQEEIKIQPDDYQIPILSMQMLVENALKHNYFSKKEPLTIEIYTEGNHCLVVRNNLKRRPVEEKPTKLGLENIANRYEMLHARSVEVTETDEHFTVKLPLIPVSQ